MADEAGKSGADEPAGKKPKDDKQKADKPDSKKGKKPQDDSDSSGSKDKQKKKEPKDDDEPAPAPAPAPSTGPDPDKPPPGGGGGSAKPAPKALPRKPEEGDFNKRNFPHMDLNKVLIVGERGKFNCMALTLGEKGRSIWPEDIPGNDTTKKKLNDMYADRGYVPADNPKEAAIAVWGLDENHVRHVAIVHRNGQMESKIGEGGYQIKHPPEVLNGPQYGKILYYLKKGPPPKPKPGPRRPGQDEPWEPEDEPLLRRLEKDGHSVLLNGSSVLKNGPREGALLLSQQKKGLIKKFRTVVRQAEAISKHRREMWVSALSSPVRMEFQLDYWIHFIINIDAVLGWIDEPDWSRCKKGDCPENAYKKKKPRG